MAIKKFNSIDGFSVGSDTPIAVIDNVANVSANSLVVSNYSNLGNVGNITITGGNAGYVLKTDGAGNLTWSVDSATAGGNSTYVQFNDAGSIAGNGNFTFDKTTSLLTVTGNISTSNANLGNLGIANYFVGNGSYLTSITGANVTGYVPNATNANIATIAGTVTTASQPNITSVGNLSNLIVTGNITSGNANLGNLVIANYFTGNGSLLHSVPGANITGNVNNAIQSHYANIANSVAGANVTGQVGNALIAGTVYTNAQPNITSVGVLSNLSVTGNVTAGNISGVNLITSNYFTGIITTTHQPNIESVGDLVGLTVSNVSGIVNFDTTANVSLGNVSNLHITGGSAGYVLTTNGYGDLSWETAGSSGNGFVSIRKDNFVGNGVQTQFSLTAVPSGEDAVEVNLNGLIQQGYVYSVVGSNVVFTTAPASGANIEITTFGALAINQTDSQILFINGSNLVGSNNFTFTESNNTLSVNNVSSTANISAGNIKSDNLLYANGSPYVFTTSASGSNTQVQFNDNNSFAGSTNFTFDKGTNTLSVTNIIANGYGITYITGSNVVGNVNYSITSNWANIANSVSGSNVSGQVGNALVAGTVYTAAQPNITSVGTLLGLSITGNLDITGNVNTTGNLNYSNVNDLVVGDPLIYLGANNTGNLYDLGIVASYNDGTYYHTGIARDATDGTWKLFDQVVAEPTTVIDFANGTYAPFKTGSFTSIGNITSVNANLGNLVVANYFSGDGSLLTNINAGNIAGAYSNTNVASYLPTYTGNVSANYFIGNGSLLTNITGSNVSGNVNFAITSNWANIANSVNGANVSGQVSNALIAGTVYTNAQPNITSVGVLSNLSVTGNVSAGNVAVGSGTGGSLTGANLISANYFVGDGSLLTGLPAQYANSNVANYLPTYTGNVSANYFIGNGSTLTYITGSNVNGNVTSAIQSHYANIANSISGSNVTGNVADAVHAYYADVANSVSGSNVSGNVNYAITSNYANIANSISGSNVSGNVSDAVHAYYADTANSIAGGNVTGQVGNALIAGTVYTNSQPNITSVGTLTELNVSGNTTIIGNLTITGNLEYINVTSLQIEDPIIELGGGANGAPLTTNDGKDRGTLLHYYTTSTVDAFMGWDNSNGEFAFGSNVTVSNEVVTYNSFGNIRAGYYIGDGSLLTNINAGNITGAYSNTNVAAYLPTYTGNVSANYFIGNGSTLTYITGSNVSGNVPNAIQSHYANIANSVSGSNVSGNVADAVHAYYADTANSVAGANVTGQVGNALIAGTVYTNSQPNITSVGTLTNLSVTGNITSGNASLGNLTIANYFSGDGSLLTNINGANVSDVANANYANYAGTAYAVSGSNVSGNVADAVHAYYADVANSVSGSNVTGQVSNALIAGTVYTNSQPNITSLGTLTDLTVNGLTDLGSVSNITITGGTTGYVLTTNGAGDLSWQAAGGSTGPGFVNITKNSFTGNGVQTIFTLTTTPASEASLLVNIDGITQQDAAYSLSGSNVTFTSAPLNGEIVEIVSYGSIAIGSNTTVLFNDAGDIGNTSTFSFNKYSNTLSITNIDTTSITFDTGVITVAGSNAGIFSSGIDNINIGLAANVTVGSTSGNTTIQGNLIAGNISATSNLAISGTATISNLKVNDLYSNRTPVSVTTNTVVDSFSINKYRSAKYTMRVNSDDGYQAVEVLLIHDGSNSYVTIYGSLSTIGTDIVTLSSNILSGNVRLLATTGSANTTVNLLGTYVAD